MRGGTALVSRRMPLLALDAALARASAAVLAADGTLLAEAAVEGARGQAAALAPLVARVLREAGIDARALRAVAATVGPGGFTGLRAALALAHGLALAGALARVGVTTGEALALGVPAGLRAGRAVWSVTAAGQGRVALERIAAGDPALPRPDGPPLLVAQDALPLPDGPVVLTGDAAAAALAVLRAAGRDAVPAPDPLPAARRVGRVALARLAGLLPARDLAPLYAAPPSALRPGVA